MPRWPLIALAFALGGCGGTSTLRPLRLEITGLSARADRLVLKAFPESTGQTCLGVDLNNVAGLDAPITDEWSRDSMAPRELELADVAEEAVVIVAYSLTASEPIQFVCRRVTVQTLTQATEGIVELLLSPRVRPD